MAAFSSSSYTEHVFQWYLLFFCLVQHLQVTFLFVPVVIVTMSSWGSCTMVVYPSPASMTVTKLCFFTS
jgi:hypothetical protein